MAQETGCKTVELSDMSSLTPIPTVQCDCEGISLENTQATCFPLDLLSTWYFNLNKSLTLSNMVISTFELKNKSPSLACKPLEDV